jgi:hypothetical protein
VPKTYDSIVIGAGAAGLYCALTAGARGRRVLVLEQGRTVGAKILISGGGRCNFTNIHTAPGRFLSANPDFARSALARHPPAAFIALVERHRIAYYEKTLGQLFCVGAGQARAIVGMLLEECAAGGVEIRTGCAISAVSRPDRFRIETDQGAFEAGTLTLATGGLSIPKLGATDFTHRVAARFGLGLVAPRPGLTPLTFDAGDLAWMRPLSGLAAPVIATAGGVGFREAALFTHRGMSGPAILQVSSYRRTGDEIAIDWLPDSPPQTLLAAKRARPHAHLKTALAELLPARLAEALSAQAGLGARLANPARPPGAIGPATGPAAGAAANLADIKDQALIDFGARLKAWTLCPSGDEGYQKAEVTVGGVDTRDLNQRTMEANDVPGLFVIGEAVDVTGWLGGYNFQWAWSSGWSAGEAQ